MRTAILGLLTPIIKLLPETRFFGLKRILYRLCGAEIGCGVQICSSATFLGSGRLSIGKNTWVGHQVMIVTGSSVKIGDEVDIAPRAFLGTGTHALGNLEKAAGEGLQKPISIGSGSWLGAGCLVLPGIVLAQSTTVGAGSIVTRGTDNPGTIIAGSPAREIGKIQ